MNAGAPDRDDGVRTLRDYGANSARTGGGRAKAFSSRFNTKNYDFENRPREVFVEKRKALPEKRNGSPAVLRKAPSAVPVVFSVGGGWMGGWGVRDLLPDSVAVQRPIMSLSRENLISFGFNAISHEKSGEHAS